MKKILALIAAAVMMLTAAGCSGETADTADVKSEGVMTYAEYAAAELETPVVVETYVQAKQGWWDNKATFYTQDKEGGYYLYNMPCTEEEYSKLTPGTKIKVSGYKTAWSDEVEIIDSTFEIMEGNYIAEAMDATALLGTDELVNHQNKFVSFKGLTVEASTDATGNEAAYLYGWDGSGEAGTDSDLYFNASINGNTYTFVIEYYLCNETTAAYQAVQGLNIGDTIDLEGFLFWYNGAQPHVTSVIVK
ncbi:MAG: acid shock protein [Clostridia bacterium]|nr:acid shock protein [Clostridia bacterium]